MELVIYFDIEYKEVGKLNEIDLEKDNIYYVDENINYDMHIGGYNITGKTNRFSKLNGKKVIEGINLQECGYWPYDKKIKYEKFIIGSNENGEEIEFECNPEILNDYYDKNQNAPQYLTPVFFTKDVLNKYYSKPEIYSIEDGILRCGGL